MGNIRYNELKRQVHGITNIMLTRSLQELEAHGLVSRIQYSEIPPHVEYCLTKAGQKLIPALHELKNGEKNRLFLKGSYIQLPIIKNKPNLPFPKNNRVCYFL